MKYNKREIMKRAWNLFNCWKGSRFASENTFSQCLHTAWDEAKAAIRKAEEAAKKASEEAKRQIENAANGIVRMSYAEYKNNYAECRTVANSYDKRTKTIEVYTTQKKKEYHMYVRRNGRRIQWV